MAVLFTQAVALKAGQPMTSPGLQIADSVEVVRATLSHWTGTNMATISVQMSFDAGVTWRDVAAIGPVTSPGGTFKNRVDLWVQLDQVWRLCGFIFPVSSHYRPGQVCGEVYFTGYPPETTIHSEYAFQDTRQVVYRDIHFHDPNLTPLIGGPLRQVRATITVSGNVNSTLTVDGS